MKRLLMAVTIPRLTTGLAAATAATVLLATASPASGSGTCSARGSTTVATNSSARIYLAREDSFGIRFLMGCLRSTSRTSNLGLGDDFFRGRDGLVRLAGPVVATAANDGGSFSTVVVTDLARRRRLHSVDIENLPNHDQPIVTDLVVRRTGAAAWIITNVNGYAAPAGSEVDVFRAHGERTLEADNGIVPHSLRLSGTTLRWRNASRTRTSTLN
jgi:hypothetical protein